MAKKTKSAAKDTEANVVRIKASSSASSKKSAKATEVVAATPVAAKAPKTRTKRKLPGVIRVIVDYFVGAWRELRQVRWPNRGATWSLTGAVLLFSAFFVVLVLLLDAAFKYLFQLILGK